MQSHIWTCKIIYGHVKIPVNLARNILLQNANCILSCFHSLIAFSALIFCFCAGFNVFLLEVDKNLYSGHQKFWKLFSQLTAAHITIVTTTLHRTPQNCILYQIKVTLLLKKSFTLVHYLNLIQQRPCYYFSYTCDVREKKGENPVLCNQRVGNIKVK